MFNTTSNFDASLLDEFRRLQQGMDHLFGNKPWPNGIRAVASGTYPPINVGSTQEQVDVYLFAAGLDPKQIDISIQKNLLTIAGERKAEQHEGANYYRKERYNGAFRRVLTLPDDVDPDKVTARYRDGVLHITVLRSESAKPRQITVN